MLREFQEEVEERAQRELLVSVPDSGSSTSYEATVSAFSTAPVYSSNGRITAGNGRQPVVATPPDLQARLLDIEIFMIKLSLSDVLLYCNAVAGTVRNTRASKSSCCVASIF